MWKAKDSLAVVPTLSKGGVIMKDIVELILLIIILAQIIELIKRIKK